MRFRLLTHTMASASARALAQGLGILRVYRDERSRFRPRAGDVIINWGCSTPPQRYEGSGCVLSNEFDSVNNASDKWRAFTILDRAGIPCPGYTTDRQQAQDWIDGGHGVVVRHLLRGSGGAGIELITEGLVPIAPLYTKYQKKTHEYRVHVLPNGTTKLHQKRRSRSVADEDVNWQVRNVDNGFIYARDNVTPNERVVALGIKAVKALGLDFGAVDILYHRPTSTVMVLEVNTAPGIEGSLLEDYINAFKYVGELYE